MDFFPILNWIFTACSVQTRKNSVHKTRNFKLGNVKNPGSPRPHQGPHLSFFVYPLQVMKMQTHWLFVQRQKQMIVLVRLSKTVDGPEI